MNVYKINTVKELLEGNPYPGRGIMIGRTADGTKAAIAYFIMGRSANSRNRIFVEDGDTLYTKAYDESKVEDPSLIIYRAVRTLGNRMIVTNGDQTDTIYEGLKEGKDFRTALKTRCFEPDGPNFTPRISGMLTFSEGDFNYEMSILKSADAVGSACSRYHYEYPALNGVGHFIHTYVTDGSPIPTFQGEPERVMVPDSIDDFASEIWGSLDKDNRISLFVRYTELSTGRNEERLINRNK